MCVCVHIWCTERQKDQDKNIHIQSRESVKNLGLHIKTLSATSENISFSLILRRLFGPNSFKAQLEMDQL